MRGTHCWNLSGLCTGPDGWTNYDHDSSLSPNTDTAGDQRSALPHALTLTITFSFFHTYHLPSHKSQPTHFSLSCKLTKHVVKEILYDFWRACLYRTAQSQKGDWCIHWLVYNLMGVFWEFHACYIITIPFIHRIPTYSKCNGKAEEHSKLGWVANFCWPSTAMNYKIRVMELLILMVNILEWGSTNVTYLWMGEVNNQCGEIWSWEIRTEQDNCLNDTWDEVKDQARYRPY